MRRRVLFVSRTRHSLPLSESLAKKWDALAVALDVRVLAASRTRGSASDLRFDLVPPAAVLDGPRFWLALPVRVARAIRGFEPDAIVAQSPFEALAALLGRRLARRGPAVICEVHGDWRSFSRLYGSRRRVRLAGVTDRLAALSVRRADAVRTISAFTSELVRAEGREPDAEFPAYVDLEAFTAAPVAALPTAPRALFVGVLERYKAIDVLAEAWRLAAPSVPDATLHIVGRGTLGAVAAQLVADLPERTRWSESLTAAEVAEAMDEATVLVLPSRSEGLGRVIIEAFCRGRGVVASRVGGIPDLAADGASAVLVPPEDVAALADALVRVLTDRELAARLGEEGRRAAEPWIATPEQYAERVRELVEEVLR